MRSKTWIQAGRFSAILIAAAAFSACGSDDDPKTLNETHPEPPSANCEFGGKVNITGKDLNGDGVLSSDEIESRTYDCNADPGNEVTDGTERLHEEHPEPAGANCDFGGVRKITGIDKDEDGVLSFSEIDDTTYECDADPGNGDDPERLHEEHPEPAGANCAFGGVRKITGLDLDEDGVLSPSEIDDTTYECEDGPEGERLTEVNAIGPTPDCLNGGQEIVTGIDADESADLQESEIDSRGYLCADYTPGGTLIDVEVIPVGDAACANGGKIIHSGVDINEDNVLQETEREDSMTLCEPADGVCDGVAAIQVQSATIAVDSFSQHSLGDIYPITVRLSRPLDPDSLEVTQFDEAFAPNADFLVSQSDPGVLTLNWEAVDGNGHNGNMLVADECGMVFVSVGIPAVYGVAPGVRATLDYKEYNVGDDYEFCWESRDMDYCEVQEQSAGTVATVGTDDCYSFELEATNFSNGYVSGMSLKCFKGTYQLGQAPLAQPQSPAILNATMLNELHFPSSGGELQLRWNGTHVDDCEVVTPDGRFPAPKDANDAFVVPIQTSGRVSIECKDANEDVVSETFQSFVVVGAGIEMFYASVSEGQGDLYWNVGVKTYFLDGTCDVTVTRGEFSLEPTVLEPTTVINYYEPYEREANDDGVRAGEGASFDPEDALHAEIRCSNADGSNEQVMTYPN